MVLPEILTRVSGALFICVLVTSIIGVATPQIIVDFQPLHIKYPTLVCTEKIFYWKSKVECPGRSVVNTDLSRDTGIYGCVDAYDTFLVSYGLTILGLLFTALGFILFAISRFYEKISTGAVAIVSGIALAFFTIAWPTTWAQSYIKQCDRYMKDVKFSGADFEKHVLDVTRGDGCNLVTSAWALSFVLLFVLVVKTYETSIKNMLKMVVVPNVDEEAEAEKAADVAAAESEMAAHPSSAVSAVAAGHAMDDAQK